MTVGQFTRQFAASTIGALVLIGGAPALALAQADHLHATPQQQEQTPEQKKRASALVEAVARLTASTSALARFFCSGVCSCCCGVACR